MRLKLLITISLFVLCFGAFSQSAVIRGVIKETLSGKPVELATITIEGAAVGAQSDSTGSFAISGLKPGIYNIHVSCLGYKTKGVAEIEITNSHPAILSIELEPEASQIKEVEITASPFTQKEESPTSVRSIGTNEIQRTPGANRDISRVIQTLPGVGFSAAFRNDLIIRGGSPAENKFYMDDIEIPNINHFSTQGGSGGPVGLINVDFIREVNFYSSAFPADRGNMLSSAMDIRLRDARDDRWSGALTLGITDAALSMESPLNRKKNLTILASVRSSYYNWFFKLIQVPIFPNYNDAQVKLKWKADNKNELEFVSLTACDIFKLNLAANKTGYEQFVLLATPINNQWSYTNGLKFTHLFNNSYLQVVASSSELVNEIYKYLNNNSSLPKTINYNSIESETKLRLEYIARINGWKYYAGLSGELAYYYNSSLFTGPYFNYNYTTRLIIPKCGAFASVSKTVANNRLLLSVGLRLDGNTYNSSMANLLNQVSPRFAMACNITPQVHWNFNTGYYHELPAYTVLGYRDSTEALVNQNRITYMRCVHVVSGFDYLTPVNSRLSVEGFFKQYFNTPYLLDDSVALANLGGNFGVVGNDPATSTSKGRAYGVEFLYEQKLFKGWYCTIAYTLFWSRFQNGTAQYVASSWDTRNIISATLGKKLKHNWEVGLRYRVQGGRPYTPYNVPYSSLVAVYNANPGGVPDYGQVNTLRLPWFHQLDIRVTKKWYLTKGSVEVYLDVQNVYYNKEQDTPVLLYLTGPDGSPLLTPNHLSYQTKLIATYDGVVQPQLGIILTY